MDIQSFISNAEKAVNAINKVLLDPGNKFNKDQIAKITPIACEILASIGSMSAAVATKTGTLEGELRAYKEIKKNIPPQNNFNICEAIHEINEINERSKNIILCNVPESTKVAVTDKIMEDQTVVTDIISKIDTPATNNIVKMYRFGKYNSNKPRPIKIHFDNSQTARSLQGKKHLLKDNLRIYSDSTPAQQKHLTDLRIELEKRKANGETDITIKYINSSPKIVNIHPKN